MILSQKNPHPFDARIKFQTVGHKYWIDNNFENIISSTTFIKKFFKEFDSVSVIKNIVNSFDYKENPEYKYYQMKPDDIKNSWELNGLIKLISQHQKRHVQRNFFYRTFQNYP